MIKIPYDKLFPYTIGEDIANSITHGVGALLAAFGHVYLIYLASKYGTVTDVIAFAFYGMTIFLMMLMSCIYHAIRHITARDVFKRLDHSMIFLLILGTYTPIIFSYIKTQQSYILWFILLAFTIVGIVFKSLFAGKFKVASTLIFIAMGWSCVVLIDPLMAVASNDFLMWLIIGGLSYTLGAVLYAFGKFKYHHAIWHLFVLLGVVAHYIAIAGYIF